METVNKEITFKHRPKLGDVIYSLPFIRAIYERTQKPCVLYLDPYSPYFQGQKDEWTNKFNSLIPLIKLQPYIKDCKLYDGEAIDYDLDKYMETTHLKRGDRISIVENHFIAFDEPYNELINGQKWLTDMPEDHSFNTVVARSSNHRNQMLHYNDAMDKAESLRFVGTTDEYMDFCKEYPHADIRFVGTVDILELATAIGSCKQFIGNQSLPLAIALGLGKDCLVEESPAYPNCIVGFYKRLR